MILPDHAIHRRMSAAHGGMGKLVIEPFEPRNVQPATVDLTLANDFKIMVDRGIPIDPYRLDVDTLYEYVRIPHGMTFSLEPGMFVLGSTVERFEFPADLAGRLEGKSSLARLGLVVHSTAGFFDPGFKGTCTLEFSSSAPSPVLLYPGMKIAHMSFHLMDGAARTPYGQGNLGSKYMNQLGATESRYDLNERVTP